MHIGNRIEEVIKQNGQSARWLAERIPTERTNVYTIFGIFLDFFTVIKIC